MPPESKLWLFTGPDPKNELSYHFADLIKAGSVPTVLCLPLP
jgi:hypothetical protein